MAYFCTYCGNQLTEDTQFCTNCGTKIGEPDPPQKRASFAEKKQKVMAQNKSKSGNKGIIYLSIAIAAILGMVAFNDSLPVTINPILEKQPIVAAAFKYPVTPQRMVPTKTDIRDGKIIIPLDRLKKEKFLRFEYPSNGYKTPLLAYISGEGKAITAISMCEPCNSTTFHIRGDNFICNSCGTTWEVDNLNGISGSCQKYPPDVIPSIVVGNEIQINESIVANWRRRI